LWPQRPILSEQLFGYAAVTTEERLKSQIESAFETVKVTVPRRQRLVVEASRDSLALVLMFLSSKGFEHLCAISCVDWIDRGTFGLVYHLASHREGIHTMVNISIPREDAHFISVASIFPNAQTYEREIFEMFGVKFEGNKRLIPLLLDHWEDIPPMRKDFDTREYVKQKFESIKPLESKE